ncbi:MAG: hypothetical protein ACI89J_000111 [Hyphomicrobiaceae bacterium]
MVAGAAKPGCVRMTYSLNELAGLLRKAAMGAGFPTGHGVAISEAGVWLARRGVPVCDLVARSIGRGMRESAIDRAAQVVTFQTARASVDGVSAIDLLLARTLGDTIELQGLDEPVLLLGLAGVAAELHNVGFEMRHVGGISSVGTAVLGFDAIKPGTVMLGLTSSERAEAASDLATRYDPVAVGDNGWEKLGALAYKTYVPASEQSRISGAGAGLTDNN